MIDPNRNERRRYGIQGQLSFDPGHPNTNVSLYNQIKKFMQSENGLGGSGGELANRLETARGFSASHVFNTSVMRRDAEARLNKQLEEYLNQIVGPAAQQDNTSIPQFLSSQGINGVQYRRDNFIETSQNPITGSSEKLARAYMGQIGARSKIVGGTNENRRLVAFLRPSAAAHVNSVIDEAAQQVNTGTYNKSDFEGLYGSAEERILAKSRRNDFRNNIAIGNINAAPPAVLEEYKSRLLKQHGEKQLVNKARQELIESGALPPDAEKERKISPAAAAARGASSVIAGIATTISTIKSLAMSMVSLLTSLSVTMGRLVKDAGATGVSPDVIDRMRKLGLKNSTYYEGNEFAVVDALKTQASKAGDVIRAGGMEFGGYGVRKYSSLITPIMKSAINENPLEGMKAVYGQMAALMVKANFSNKEKFEQHKYLETAFDAKYADTYIATINSAQAGKRLNAGNAHNFLENEMSAANVDKLSNGTPVDSVMGQSAGAIDFTHNTAALNNILGDIKIIENQLYMMLLSNLDIIIQIMLGIGKAVLGLATKVNVPGAAEGLKNLTKAEKGMAEQGYHKLAENTEKFGVDAKGRISEYFSNKGLRGENLEKATNATFGLLSSGGTLPAKFADLTKGASGVSLLASIGAYNYGNERLKNITNGVANGEFSESGNIYNILQAAMSKINTLKAINGATGQVTRGYVEGVDNIGLSSEQWKSAGADVHSASRKITPDRTAGQYTKAYLSSLLGVMGGVPIGISTQFVTEALQQKSSYERDIDPKKLDLNYNPLHMMDFRGAKPVTGNPFDGTGSNEPIKIEGTFTLYDKNGNIIDTITSTPDKDAKQRVFNAKSKK